MRKTSSSRRYSFSDQLCLKLETALSSSFGSPLGTGRSYPAEYKTSKLNRTEVTHAARLMRVNHAGEVAAQGLYQGQAATAKLTHTRRQMLHSATEESDHLCWCIKRLAELDATPSRLGLLWYTGAYAIGASAGLCGDRWSLGFVAETEHQVVEHLDKHFKALPPGDARSRAIVTQMRVDEAQHGEQAKQSGAAPLPHSIRILMRWTASLMTKSAYWI